MVRHIFFKILKFLSKNVPLLNAGRAQVFHGTRISRFHRFDSIYFILKVFMVSLIHFCASKLALSRSTQICVNVMYATSRGETFHLLPLKSKNPFIDWGVKTSNEFTLEIAAFSMHLTLD